MSEPIDLSSVPQGCGIQLAQCGNPECGPHIVVLDENDDPVIHVAIPKKHLLEVIKLLQGILYNKVVDGDDDGMPLPPGGSMQ